MINEDKDKEKFIVTEKAQRPAKADGKCFYCNMPIGAEHKKDCVLIKKKVKVRAIIDYNIYVPNHWEKEAIEFFRNEGSWCSNNMIDELSEYSKLNGCLCWSTKFEYLKDVSGPELNE